MVVCQQIIWVVARKQSNDCPELLPACNFGIAWENLPSALRLEAAISLEAIARNVYWRRLKTPRARSALKALDSVHRTWPSTSGRKFHSKTFPSLFTARRAHQFTHVTCSLHKKVPIQKRKESFRPFLVLLFLCFLCFFRPLLESSPLLKGAPLGFTLQSSHPMAATPKCTGWQARLSTVRSPPGRNPNTS